MIVYSNPPRPTGRVSVCMAKSKKKDWSEQEQVEISLVGVVHEHGVTSPDELRRIFKTYADHVAFCLFHITSEK